MSMVDNAPPTAASTLNGTRACAAGNARSTAVDPTTAGSAVGCTINSVVRTTCPYCGVGCGVLARRANGSVEIFGDPDHPANSGILCSKGSALADTLVPDGRLLFPRIGSQRVAWEAALDHVAQGFSRIIREHGPDAVAFYVSGQLLTEDYYVANKLMKGFIGSANIDTNSRLCMASAVAGHKRAFGEDLVPGCYEDFELADLIVLVGSNTAWCHPILFRRIAQARERRPELKLVVIDPRRTPTCDTADVHLPIRAGTDVWLFNGLLAYLHEIGAVDREFVSARTSGLDATLRAARAAFGDAPAERRVESLANAVAHACGTDAGRIREFFELFARTERVVTAFSQGVNQSSAGTDKVNSIINCHLLTGRIGRPGMGPFSITGQPNAMGGREVGGLANTLAAHLEISNPVHRAVVQDFWSSPQVANRPGLKAVELFDAIHAGRVKAVWIMATNPVVSLPDADRVREALSRCELVVVSDCMARTDTTQYAHVLLPAAAWGEKDGTVTNSERRISRQRAFLPLPGEAKPDWWMLCEVARRMGFTAGFGYTTPGEIFEEHARLSCTQNDGASARAFNIGGLAGLTSAEYDNLEPVQWPVPPRPVVAAARGMRTHPAVPSNAAARAPVSPPGGGMARLFADGRFWHADGKARFVPTAPRLPAHPANEDFPLVLNTGRIRDQWHTMTRTGLSPRLADHIAEPFVDMHAHDALLAGVRVGELARITTRWGSMIARVRASGEMARGTAFVPIHWNAQYASDGRVGPLVNPVVDPISGEPEFKHTPVRVEPYVVDWYGLILSRGVLDGLDVAWWTLVRGSDFVRYEFAGRRVPADWSAWGRATLGADAPEADYLDYSDDAAGAYRAAHLVDDRVVACLYVSRRPQLPARTWLASLFAKEKLEESDRSALLAGRPRGPALDTGPLVCSCFGVGRKTICDAITRHGLTNVKAVGARLRAGTNCGSCVPEIRALIAASQVPAEV